MLVNPAAKIVLDQVNFLRMLWVSRNAPARAKCHLPKCCCGTDKLRSDALLSLSSLIKVVMRTGPNHRKSDVSASNFFVSTMQTVKAMSDPSRNRRITSLGTCGSQGEPCARGDARYPDGTIHHRRTQCRQSSPTFNCSGGHQQSFA